MTRLESCFPYRLAVVAKAFSRGLVEVHGRVFGLSREDWRFLAPLAQGPNGLRSPAATCDPGQDSDQPRGPDIPNVLTSNNLDDNVYQQIRDPGVLEADLGECVELEKDVEGGCRVVILNQLLSVFAGRSGSASCTFGLYLRHAK